ncbi:thiamine-phosphate kinase [Aerosakkonema funiforme]|uniref:Thiamine-monophosphate kinase n=1 Tax=Aerosakkonema funiforme FACHB-1375 TaxID=2949571 RepID=A0A926VHB2_9CYAN|nr:thiamine-phosphate kinase [Aerosakkonema funiforme]MBD2183739.1 thiamine-phosphate kinase [Aerosakkonema funiforme FACHB-1375]
MSSLKVRDIGEQGLLKRLQSFCPADIIGDDAAVMQMSPGQSLVVTTDVLVDGVHFSDRTTSPSDVGWRAAAANLSDLAAMGATPLGITIGLGVTGDTAVSWVEQVYQGMTECLQQYNTVIAGGDVVRSPVITISITAFGEAFPHRIIRRSNAKVGDAIVVTGFHGASRAGLELLLHPELGKNLSEADRKSLIQAHQRPKPRLDILPTLWDILDYQSKIQNPKSKIELAGMDSSDGLADAVVQICKMSGVGGRIERSHIPIPQSLHNWISPEQAIKWALYGGEDFELVLCLPPEVAKILVKRLGNSAAIVGRITSDSDVRLVDAAGCYPEEVLSLIQGFQHF